MKYHRHRSSPWQRRQAQLGQSLLIFALTSTVLFALVGIGVDVGTSYFMSNRVERAAAAAALAGVTYMPTFGTNHVKVTPVDATTEALNVAALNSFTDGDTNGNVTVDTAQVADPANPGQYLRNQLQVTVAVDQPTTFLKLLGFGTHRIKSTVIAEYLRPITLGQPGSQVGSDLPSLGSSGNPYFMRNEGWSSNRGEGDAYMPNPADPSNPTFASGSPPDTHLLSTANGTETSAASGLPQRGGYNFLIYIPPNQTGNVQVYNPIFAPDNGYSSTSYNYHEQDSFVLNGTCSGSITYGSADTPSNGSGCRAADTPAKYADMKYSLFTVANQFNNAQDQLDSTLLVKPIDATAAPVGKYRNVTAATFPNGALSSGLPTSLYHAWRDITADVMSTDNGLTTLTKTSTYIQNLTGGSTGAYYRLRVDQVDLTGGDPQNGGNNTQESIAHKGYAVRVVAPTGSTCTSCTIGALNDAGIFTPVQGPGSCNSSSNFNVPLMSIPPEYAGQTVDIYVFDPGDLSGGCATPSNNLSIVQPDGTTIATTADGVFSLGSSQIGTAHGVVSAGGAATVQTQCASCNPVNTYNGTWLRYDIAIPTTYNPGANPSNWFWYLRYATNETADDTITVSVGFNGTPVHLISG